MRPPRTWGAPRGRPRTSIITGLRFEHAAQPHEPSGIHAAAPGGYCGTVQTGKLGCDFPAKTRQSLMVPTTGGPAGPAEVSKAGPSGLARYCVSVNVPV